MPTISGADRVPRLLRPGWSRLTPDPPPGWAETRSTILNETSTHRPRRIRRLVAVTVMDAAVGISGAMAATAAQSGGADPPVSDPGATSLAELDSACRDHGVARTFEAARFFAAEPGVKQAVRRDAVNPLGCNDRELIKRRRCQYSKPAISSDSTWPTSVSRLGATVASNLKMRLADAGTRSSGRP